MSRSLPILGLVLAASITAAADSSADTTPKFGALPLGTVTQHPSGKAPPRIPATDKVEGFYVAIPVARALRPWLLWSAATSVAAFLRSRPRLDAAPIGRVSPAPCLPAAFRYEDGVD